MQEGQGQFVEKVHRVAVVSNKFVCATQSCAVWTQQQQAIHTAHWLPFTKHYGSPLRVA